jgi:hypothetical protein
MIEKIINIIFTLILIALGAYSLFFQIAKFISVTLNRSILHPEEDRFLSNNLPHLFTIIVCVYFVTIQIKKVLKNLPVK